MDSTQNINTFPLQVLTKEYYSIQANMDKKVGELESQIGEKNARLASYEKVEKELDEVVLQAAEGIVSRDLVFRGKCVCALKKWTNPLNFTARKNLRSEIHF